jgi:hypothetical protein
MIEKNIAKEAIEMITNKISLSEELESDLKKSTNPFIILEVMNLLRLDFNI